MAKKTFLEDTRLFPDLANIGANEKPKESREEVIAPPVNRKAPIKEAVEGLKQYGYYNSPERHKKLKMWTITSSEPDEKDVSAVIRKALDEFFERHENE